MSISLLDLEHLYSYDYCKALLKQDWSQPNDIPIGAKIISLLYYRLLVHAKFGDSTYSHIPKPPPGHLPTLQSHIAEIQYKDAYVFEYKADIPINTGYMCISTNTTDFMQGEFTTMINECYDEETKKYSGKVVFNQRWHIDNKYVNVKLKDENNKDYIKNFKIKPDNYTSSAVYYFYKDLAKIKIGEKLGYTLNILTKNLFTVGSIPADIRDCEIYRETKGNDGGPSNPPFEIPDLDCKIPITYYESPHFPEENDRGYKDHYLIDDELKFDIKEFYEDYNFKPYTLSFIFGNIKKYHKLKEDEEKPNFGCGLTYVNYRFLPFHIFGEVNRGGSGYRMNGNYLYKYEEDYEAYYDRITYQVGMSCYNREPSEEPFISHWYPFEGEEYETEITSWGNEQNTTISQNRHDFSDYDPIPGEHDESIEDSIAREKQNVFLSEQLQALKDNGVKDNDIIMDWKVSKGDPVFEHSFQNKSGGFSTNRTSTKWHTPGTIKVEYCGNPIPPLEDFNVILNTKTIKLKPIDEKFPQLSLSTGEIKAGKDYQVKPTPQPLVKPSIELSSTHYEFNHQNEDLSWTRSGEQKNCYKFKLYNDEDPPELINPSVSTGDNVTNKIIFYSTGDQSLPIKL